MNVKRQYSLPNCNLILEGLENVDSESADILSGQPPMSVLLNAECHLLKSNQKISGGSVFLTNLSQAVSNYAQGILSGLFHNDSASSDYPQISISQLSDQHLHRLTVEPEPNSGEAKTEVNITTVELFDLVDAIDQFHADSATLPNMTLELRSVSRRFRKPEQPLAERLTPVVIGFTSFAILAGSLLMVPPPELETPASAPVETEDVVDSQSEPEPEAELEAEPEN